MRRLFSVTNHQNRISRSVRDSYRSSGCRHFHALEVDNKHPALDLARKHTFADDELEPECQVLGDEAIVELYKTD